MLQDLDARGGATGVGVDPLLVKPVARPEPKLVPRVAIAVSLTAVLVAGGWYSWRTMTQLRARPVVAQGPMPLAALPPGMVRVMPPVSEPVPPAAPVVIEEAAAPAVPAPVVATPARPPRRAVPVVATAPETVIVPAAAPVTRGGQNAEGEYRRALSDLQEGRVTDAIAALERTLQLDPRHDSARQILVGLLVEAKRNDDAVRQLQLGLGLDPRQPAMAMLLARLQLDNSNASGAIDTLQRTLPYAKGNGDYQAFLAGMLQRQGRNGDAVVQYQAALGATPGNAVWLMGLGVALQADKHNPEALDAFQRAAAAGVLTSELQAFVERRIAQLSH